MLVKIKKTNGDWKQALAEIKNFLKEYQPSGGDARKQPMPIGVYPGPQNNLSNFKKFLVENFK